MHHPADSTIGFPPAPGTAHANTLSFNPAMTSTASPLMVIGHKNPDTDSICSAIAYAH